MDIRVQNLNVKQAVKIAVIALLIVSVQGFLIGNMIGTIWSLNLDGFESALTSFITSFETEALKQLALAER